MFEHTGEPDASRYKYFPVDVPGLLSKEGPVFPDGVPPKSVLQSISSTPPFKSLINISYKSIDKKYLKIIDNNGETLKSIAGIESFSLNTNNSENSAQILVDDATFNISLKGVINI